MGYAKKMWLKNRPRRLMDCNSGGGVHLMNKFHFKYTLGCSILHNLSPVSLVVCSYMQCNGATHYYQPHYRSHALQIFTAIKLLPCIASARLLDCHWQSEKPLFCLEEGATNFGAAKGSGWFNVQLLAFKSLPSYQFYFYPYWPLALWKLLSKWKFW